jgi:sugar/nucleoside kinase (ribokinase family)
MVNRKFRISGTGCALVDYLYKPVDFSGEGFKKYFSRTPGDGGLSPGKLVFTGELEKFAGTGYPQIRQEITGGMEPMAINIGGPSIVSLIHAAQVLYGQKATVSYYGCRGNDDAGRFIRERLASTPLDTASYTTVEGFTPFTDVFSDPAWDQGHGERAFVNNIGVASKFLPEEIDEDFFSSEITVFGGTALVPNIHGGLNDLLKRAKSAGSVTIVNTVYDFLSEKDNPGKPWPLGDSNQAYQYTDLLIADREEALKYSGCATTGEALAFFRRAGTGAAVITHGPNPVHFYSDGSLFGEVAESRLPASERVIGELRDNPSLAGDTTGCGDNFVGGMLASVALQLLRNPGSPADMKDAVAKGVVSGGFACFHHGGTFHEKFPGEKSQLIEKYYRAYMEQTGKQ